MLHLLLIELGKNMQMQIGKPIFHEEREGIEKD